MRSGTGPPWDALEGDCGYKVAGGSLGVLPMMKSSKRRFGWSKLPSDPVGELIINLPMPKTIVHVHHLNSMVSKD